MFLIRTWASLRITSLLFPQYRTPVCSKGKMRLLLVTLLTVAAIAVNICDTNAVFLDPRGEDAAPADRDDGDDDDDKAEGECSTKEMRILSKSSSTQGVNQSLLWRIDEPVDRRITRIGKPLSPIPRRISVRECAKSTNG